MFSCDEFHKSVPVDSGDKEKVLFQHSLVAIGQDFSVHLLLLEIVFVLAQIHCLQQHQDLD